MDASTLRASATAITPFYYQLTVAGAAQSGMNRLREIGLEAERAMLAATGGVNTIVAQSSASACFVRLPAPHGPRRRVLNRIGEPKC